MPCRCSSARQTECCELRPLGDSHRSSLRNSLVYGASILAISRRLARESIAVPRTVAPSSPRDLHTVFRWIPRQDALGWSPPPWPRSREPRFPPHHGFPTTETRHDSSASAGAQDLLARRSIASLLHA